jgi:hypothetical protein
MEILLGIFWELLEEQREQGVNVLACCDSVRNTSATVGVSDVDRLVEEDHAGIVVPRVWIENEFDVLIDPSRAQLKEEAREGRATRSAVEPVDCQRLRPMYPKATEYSPQDDRIILGVVSRFEEPVKQMLVVIVIIKIT